MKTLDRKAAEIFRSMLALQTTKIDNSDGTYMPVYLELIGRIDKYDFFSLAHYGQQNGDAMRDPEMLFCPAQKHGNSSRTTIAMTTAASSRTA